MKRVTVVDYGCGNMLSVCRALSEAGAAVTMSDGARAVERAERIVLPGVGSFAAGMAGLAARELCEPIYVAAKQDVPVLGICLGMQLLTDCGTEGGLTAGLCIIGGHTQRLQAEKVPHMGWAEVDYVTRPRQTFYFAHSYRVVVSVEDVDAISVYENEIFPAVLKVGSVWAHQGHPEKSRAAGLAFLKEWLAL